MSAAYIRAEEATTVLGELVLHLQNASRVNPRSSSRKALRKMIERPDVLDLLERLTREAFRAEQSLGLLLLEVRMTSNSKADVRISFSEFRAIEIALDDLQSYHDVMGNMDDADFKEHAMHAWAIKKLTALRDRALPVFEEHAASV